MRRRSRASSKSTKARSRKAKTLKAARRSSSSVAGQETEVARFRRELDVAREQQAATADVLKIISHSTFDLQAVLDTLVKSAARLCEADMVSITRPRDGAMQFAANFGLPQEFEEIAKKRSFVPGRGTIVGRVLLAGKPVQIADVEADQEYTFTEGQRVAGFRTVLAVPLEREGEIIGVMNLARQRVAPFTDKQIALVSNFAAQAVIAIENTRLLNELRQRTDDLTESLEQQTATSEVLGVISSSPGELNPVFNAMLENAVRLCEAEFGHLYLYDKEAFHTAALHSASQDLGMLLRRRPVVLRGLHPDAPLSRMARTKAVVHIADVRTEKIYIDREPIFSEFVDVSGARAILLMPMLKENELIGAFVVYRLEVRSFTDKQVELVQNFAAQAVIAIENTRLLNELREALDQQTATSEVLSVISSSPGELEPVFNTMLGNATRICEAKFGNLLLREEGAFRAVAWHGEPTYVETYRRDPLVIATKDTRIPLARLMQTKQPIHVADLRSEPAYRAGFRRLDSLVDEGGARTFLIVPMLKEQLLIGAISIYRQEVRPFTDKQIALVQNFAAQAVIAIENARLLNELRQRTNDLTESLEQQTATSEILDVISNSPTDVQPVLDTIVRTAMTICDSYDAVILLKDGEQLRIAAHHGPMKIDFGGAPIGRDWVSGRVVVDGVPVHVHDLTAEGTEFPLGRDIALRLNQRTVLGLPLLRDGQAIGCLFLRRPEVRPFTEKQIGLLQTFADQAVIAIENTRLFEAEQQRTRELSESLEQQTATAEVLSVISSSPGQLELVFRAMLENAVRILDAKFGTLFL